jgi:hypothetical protein
MRDARALLAAIKSRFDGSEAARLAKGLWIEEAPEGADYPFVTYSLPVNTRELTFGESFETTTVDFDIWGDEDDLSPDAVIAIYNSLTALFDDAELTLAGYSSISIDRQSETLLRDPVYGGWHYHISYEIQLQEA